jgi:PadR family transcriptional regulator
MEYDSNLTKGTLSTIILKMLQGRTMYGYEIIRTVNEQTNGRFEWKEGSLYPALHRLENEKLITGEWQLNESGSRPRKYYLITAKGTKALVQKSEEWSEFAATVNSLLLA